MGCGNSKEEVATANTVTKKRSLFRRKSNISTSNSSSATPPDTTAADQVQKISNNTVKTEEKTEYPKKAVDKTEAPQNSEDKTETPKESAEEKVQVEIINVEEKSDEVREIPKFETAAEPKDVEDEVAVVKTNDETPALVESKQNDLLTEEGETMVIKVDEASPVDSSRSDETKVNEASPVDSSRTDDAGQEQEVPVDNSATEEIKDSTVIAEASTNKEEVISKEEDDVVLVESSGETTPELNVAAATESPKADEAIVEEKIVEETPVSQQSDK